MEGSHVKCLAPTNIALIKYWGKNPKYERWHIPMKTSLSLTADVDAEGPEGKKPLYTQTELTYEKGPGLHVEFVLNSQRALPNSKDYKKVMDYFKRLRELGLIEEGRYKIVSENTFPTAAGFASSASGFAALAGTLAHIHGVYDPTIISGWARLGSGSAARSVPGGIVEWNRGISPEETLDTSDPNNVVMASTARQLWAPEHWEGLRLIYVGVGTGPKKKSSRAGMKETVNDSSPYGRLYKEWVDVEEKEVLPQMKTAIERRDFGALAPLIMRASNAFHAIVTNTYPPLHYLADGSWGVIELIHETLDGLAAYTFDAGPNPVIITLAQHVEKVKRALLDKIGAPIWITKVGGGIRCEML